MKLSISVASLIALSIAVAIGAAAQDTDGDGILDPSDNCTLVANAPPLDCDTDQDGYGNLCDADYNQETAEDSADLIIFKNDYKSTGVDVNSWGTDMDCDGVVDGADWNPIFYERWSVHQKPGPSGLSCASMVRGGCPN